jgi:cysteine synthase A
MAESILDAIGNTPLIPLHLPEQNGRRILVKVEYMSPSGGPKERIVRHIVETAEREGRLRPGMTLVEASTGSTGIATALVGAAKGYPVRIVMPEGMSRERRLIMEALGAEIELTPGAGSDIDAAIARMRELVAADPNRFFPIDQFANPLNPEAHYLGTGREIWEETGGRIDAFVAMVGTGGTVTGVARYLKEKNPAIRCFGGEPLAGATFVHGRRHPHVIEGVGDGIVPEVFDPKLLDGMVLVSDEEAIAFCRRLAREEGLLAGPSSGANVAAALKLLAADPSLETVVTLLPDSAMRYLSRGWYEGEGPSIGLSVCVERCRLAGRDMTVVS